MVDQFGHGPTTEDLASMDAGQARLTAFLFWASAAAAQVSLEDIKAVPSSSGAPLGSEAVRICEELQEDGLVWLKGWDNPATMRMTVLVGGRRRAVTRSAGTGAADDKPMFPVPDSGVLAFDHYPMRSRIPESMIRVGQRVWALPSPETEGLRALYEILSTLDRKRAEGEDVGEAIVNASRSYAQALAALLEYSGEPRLEGEVRRQMNRADTEKEQFDNRQERKLRKSRSQ